MIPWVRTWTAAPASPPEIAGVVKHRPPPKHRLAVTYCVHKYGQRQQHPNLVRLSRACDWMNKLWQCQVYWQNVFRALSMQDTKMLTALAQLQDVAIRAAAVGYTIIHKLQRKHSHKMQLGLTIDTFSSCQTRSTSAVAAAAVVGPAVDAAAAYPGPAVITLILTPS